MGRVWNKNAGLPIEKCPVSEKQSFCGSKKKKVISALLAYST